ncbi:GerA spore germination protein [Desulfotomaculum nigrificans CO-1-SRB]|uniref:GerA spore germination protein n=1 Tax=Desulfotomaculum nigrificans (strain DSM 14880 / VKM B-2319 / CO-1-SRB) TaxID=868595 RepID=F6B9K6_DESCC|nr:spore germination protein [Desulfotomaculum nigrificans]AEF94902.1 GerA spore germination protein [Desulfotomaculum nigrificans CO-1-SRB]
MPAALEKEAPKVHPDLEKNIKYLNDIMGHGKSFDIILRRFNVGGKEIAMYFVNGFVKDDIMSLILRNLDELKRSDISPNSLKKLFNEHINHIQVELVDNLEKVIDGVLSGPLALLIDGEEQALIIDLRQYPGRLPQEPDLEKVVRGPRDGFVETILMNTLLIRRRLRDPRLRNEAMQVGTRSKTDIVISYIEDIANPELVERVKKNLQKIKIDGIPMAEKAVEEIIQPGKYGNLFPKVRFTERPDVAVTHLLEGRILIMVDTSPSIIIVPSFLWDHLQAAEEYRQGPPVGVYIRWVRYIGVAITLFILPLWFLFAVQPELLPPALKFIGPSKMGKIPLIGQFLLAELAIDMIRLATIHTPTPLATSTGIIAALLIGDVAVKVGLFSSEVVMYTAIAAVASFMIPSYEMSWAVRIVRLFLLLATAAFRLPGLIIATLFTLAYLARTKSLGVPYLWPLIPFNAKEMLSVIIRTPVEIRNTRPAILHPRNPIRQAVPEPARKPGGKEEQGEK